ncbi:hypothetical protein BKA70DRAFT_1229267 [Coprinopsis sp. MPI-PUGE-AT-0042]|nr:hypothetical protein BKA70DRAFT_1229267 [Coprinopsis sp. MPI-PUGE-AT-0042]
MVHVLRRAGPCFILGVAILLAATGANSVSLMAACYICPDENSYGVPLLDASYDANFFECDYGGNSFCVYSTENGGLLSDTNAEGCFNDALNSCRIRNRRMRERALPRAPHPPSPGAFAEKPQVMHTRAELGNTKKARRNAL